MLGEALGILFVVRLFVVRLAVVVSQTMMNGLRRLVDRTTSHSRPPWPFHVL